MTDGRGDSVPAEQPRVVFAELLALAGRLEEATSLFEQFVEQDGENRRSSEGLGVLAAMRGDREEALRQSQWLEAHADPRRPMFYTAARAKIAAHLGDLEPATELLRQAIVEGYSEYLLLHSDPVWDPLRDYPPFQELIRPKG